MEQVHKSPVKQPQQQVKPKKSGLPAAFVGGPRGNFAGEGTVRIARSEIMYSVEVSVQGTNFNRATIIEPANQTMPWLYKMSSLFDQIVWENCEFSYKPACGTSFGASLVMGVDWDPQATDASRSKVQACSPVVECAAWQPITLVLPKTRLQSRRIYVRNSSSPADRAPGVLLVNLKCSAADRQTFVGDVWVKYSVVLMGPSA